MTAINALDSEQYKEIFEMVPSTEKGKLIHFAKFDKSRVTMYYYDDCFQVSFFAEEVLVNGKFVKATLQNAAAVKILNSIATPDFFNRRIRALVRQALCNSPLYFDNEEGKYDHKDHEVDDDSNDNDFEQVQMAIHFLHRLVRESEYQRELQILALSPPLPPGTVF
eukprot:m.84786 g.84786  ORF g.84786 m.84786 type:complete len:166 (+) comp12980_c0_seq3:783-1280(+)